MLYKSRALELVRIERLKIAMIACDGLRPKDRGQWNVKQRKRIHGEGLLVDVMRRKVEDFYRTVSCRINLISRLSSCASTRHRENSSGSTRVRDPCCCCEPECTIFPSHRFKKRWLCDLLSCAHQRATQQTGRTIISTDMRCTIRCRGLGEKQMVEWATWGDENWSNVIPWQWRLYLHGYSRIPSDVRRERTKEHYLCSRERGPMKDGKFLLPCSIKKLILQLLESFVRTREASWGRESSLFEEWSEHGCWSNDLLDRKEHCRSECSSCGWKRCSGSRRRRRLEGEEVRSEIRFNFEWDTHSKEASELNNEWMHLTRHKEFSN